MAFLRLLRSPLHAQRSGCPSRRSHRGSVAPAFVTIGLACGLALLSLAPSASATTVSFIDDSMGLTNPLVQALSGDGQVLAGRGGVYTWRWSETNGVEILDVLPSISYFGRGDVSAASADGSILAGTSLGDPDYEGVIWDSNGDITSIEAATGADLDPRDVSADGSIVVGFGNYLPFVWSEAGGLVFLPLLSGGFGLATGVSADGSVIAGCAGDAFVWTASSGSVPLGVLPGDDNACASTLSEDGTTVFGSSGIVQSNVYQLFRWTAAGGMEPLGTPAGTDSASAVDTDADGSITIGGARPPLPGGSGVYIPMVWTEELGANTLEEFLVLTGGVPPGFTPANVELVAISDDGLRIVGVETLPGPTYRTVILDLDPPAVVPALSTGGLAFVVGALLLLGVVHGRAGRMRSA